MAKTQYITKQVGTKVAVLRVDRFYPYGRLVTKCRSQAQAEDLIARQTAEDAENRMTRVRDYLAERAARPAPTPKVDDQMTLL